MLLIGPIFFYSSLFILSRLISASNIDGDNNNWVILINTSAYWFNYRHASNILGIYSQIRSRGIPDSRIILMVAEDIACNARNVFPGTLVNNELKRENLMEGDIEIDYRGPEVSVENFIRLLTNRHSDSVNRNKLLNTDRNSKIFIYLTGHGGENFMKFRNVEEVSAHDLAGAFDQMWQQGRYKEIIFMIDTCQAASMFSELKAPNIYGISSSKVGESSYSYTVDSEIGLSVIDRFSFKFFEFLKNSNSASTIQEFINELDPEFLGSTPNYHDELFPRPADQIKIWDFLSAQPTRQIVLTEDSESAMFAFLDSIEAVNEPLIDNNSNKRSHSKFKSDKRRINALIFDKNNSNQYYTYLSLIIGLTSILYYITITNINHPAPTSCQSDKNVDENKGQTDKQ